MQTSFALPARLSDVSPKTVPSAMPTTPTPKPTYTSGDVWLSVWLRRILSSRSYLAGSTAVFVMWDEDGDIPNIVVSPSTRPGTALTTPFDHYSALHTTE